MASVIWKGVLTFGAEVPVKFMSLVEDRNVHFRLLHREDEVPVEQRMVRDDEDGEEVVEAEEVGRAVVLEDGTLVPLTDDDRDALVPEKSRTIDVTRFVPAHALGSQWLDRPYLLVPDDAEDAYAALRDVLQDAGRVGVCRWTMRNKRYAGALMARDGWLMMLRMRFVEQVVDAQTLPRPGADESSAKELELARQLVGALREPFDHQAYEAAQRERVRELLAGKKASESSTDSVPSGEAEDLAERLRASLEARRAS